MAEYSETLQKTSVLVALACCDSIHLLLRANAVKALPDSIGLLAEIEEAAQNAYDHCRTLNGGRPIAAAALRVVEKFDEELVFQIRRQLHVVRAQDGSVQDELAIALETGNLLLYDLASITPGTARHESFANLRKKMSELTDALFESGSNKEQAEMCATEAYMQVSDYLKPENFQELFKLPARFDKNAARRRPMTKYA